MDEKQNSLFIFDRNDATMIMRRKLIHKTLRGWVFYFGKKCILPFASFGSVKTCVAAVRSGAFFRAQLRLRTFCILEDSHAFEGCSSLVEIEIADGVTSIGYSAFEDCTSLKSINIPNGVTSIGSFAFNYCKSLTSIEIPNSVANIDRYAFFYCKSLTSINFNGSMEQWRDIEKGWYWDDNTGSYMIHCTDGDISK